MRLSGDLGRTLGGKPFVRLRVPDNHGKFAGRAASAGTAFPLQLGYSAASRGGPARGAPKAHPTSTQQSWRRRIGSLLDTRLQEARNAGVSERGVRLLRGLVTLGVPAGFGLGFAVFGTAGALCGAALVYWVFESSLRRAVSAEQTRFRRSFPDALDLLSIACMAGMNPYRAFSTVATVRPEGCESVFEVIAVELATGRTISEVLVDLARQRRSAELAALSRAITGSERLGHPLGPALMRLAHDLREREIRWAQAAARRAPIKVLFPLVFCILPAFVLLTVVPVLADTFAVIRT